MNEPMRIIINGAFGKMGRVASEFLQEIPSFQIVALLGRHDDLQQQLNNHRPDVVIDLTRADCIFSNCQIYLEQKIKFIIGTSGLKPDEIQSIQHMCHKLQLGGIIVPNFSIGSVLCTYFAKLAAPWFDGVDIIEMHHAQKADAPSGTAIHTANAIHQSKSDWPLMSTTPQNGREFFVHQIPIHAVRMPGVLAYQQTLFGQIGETISINHQIIDRKAYMPGLKLACEHILTLKELVIGLEQWLIQ
jgi:4-hydroxy-tetrahydrodipicolinate reductase